MLEKFKFNLRRFTLFWNSITRISLFTSQYNVLIQLYILVRIVSCSRISIIVLVFTILITLTHFKWVEVVDDSVQHFHKKLSFHLRGCLQVQCSILADNSEWVLKPIHVTFLLELVPVEDTAISAQFDLSDFQNRDTPVQDLLLLVLILVLLLWLFLHCRDIGRLLPANHFVLKEDVSLLGSSPSSILKHLYAIEEIVCRFTYLPLDGLLLLLELSLVLSEA